MGSSSGSATAVPLVPASLVLVWGNVKGAGSVRGSEPLLVPRSEYVLAHALAAGMV